MVTPLVVGETYELFFTLSAWTAGSVVPSCGGVTFGSYAKNLTHKIVFTATSTANLTFTPTNASRFTIDNVSLKKLTGDVTVNNSLTVTGNQSVSGINVGVNASGAIDGTLSVGKAFSQHSGYANVLELNGGIAMQIPAPGSAQYSGAYLLSAFNPGGTEIGSVIVANGGTLASPLYDFYFRANNAGGNMYFGTRETGTGTLYQAMTIRSYHVGIGGSKGTIYTPTALLHLGAGSATAGTAPLKFTSGALTTAAVAGQIEYLSGLFYIRGTEGWAFGDSGTYINQANDGHLDLTADVSIDLNGNVELGAYNLTTTGTIYNKADNSKHYFGAGNDASINYNGTNMIINPKEVGAGNLTVSGDTDFSGGKTTLAYTAAAPTLTTNGDISIAVVGGDERIYFYSNGGQHYVSRTAGFVIPDFEVNDPISGEQIKEGDFVVGMINKTYEDNSLHGVWTKFDSVIGKLLESFSNNSTLTKAETESGDVVVDETSTNSIVEFANKILGKLGMTINNGIAQAKEFIAEKVTAKTARLDKIEMVDQQTGEIYCTWLENGVWKKMQGECGAVSNAQLPITNSVEIGTEISQPDSQTQPQPETQPDPQPETQPDSQSQTSPDNQTQTPTDTSTSSQSQTSSESQATTDSSASSATASPDTSSQSTSSAPSGENTSTNPPPTPAPDTSPAPAPDASSSPATAPISAPTPTPTPTPAPAPASPSAPAPAPAPSE